MSSGLVDLVGGLLGFVLTLAVFSYVLGDNPVYRMAVHLLVGLAVGYTVVLALDGVLLPWLGDLVTMARLATSQAADPAQQSDLNAYVFDQAVMLIPPVVLGLLLLLKLNGSTAFVGNVSMALLVGVGAGVAVGGAVLGTLLPQVYATVFYEGSSANLLGRNPNVINSLFNGVVIVMGTVLSLLAFFYGPSPIYIFQPNLAQNAPVNIVVQVLRVAGRAVVVFTLAALYAAALSTSLTLLADRLLFLWTTVLNLVGGG